MKFDVWCTHNVEKFTYRNLPGLYDYRRKKAFVKGYDLLTESFHFFCQLKNKVAEKKQCGGEGNGGGGVGLGSGEGGWLQGGC